MRKTWSIKTILAIAITLITFFFTLITAIILFKIATGFIEKQAKDEIKDIVKQVNLSLDYYVKDIHDLGSYVVTNLNEYNLNDEKIIKQGFDFLADSRTDINTIALFDSTGNLVLSNKNHEVKKDSNIYLQEWFSKAHFSKGNHYFTGPHVQNIYYRNYPWVISYSRYVKYHDKNNKLVDGVLLIDFNLTELEVITSNAKIGKDGYSFLIDISYNIVYHPKQELINSNLFQENLNILKDIIFGQYYDKKNHKLISINTVDNSRFRLVTISYLDNVQSEKKAMNTFVSIVVLFIFLFSILVSVFLSQYISKPLTSLSKQMLKVEEGKFDHLKIERGSSETVGLTKEFNSMLTKIDNLMKIAVENENIKRKLELEALQSKINPHFLYNTLDSVVWMAEQGDTKGVVKIIGALAKLFRISISKDHDIITIKEEIEHVRNYLTIQTMRYEGAFDFEIILPKELEQLPTIKLIIQPIVENSIYHGIKYLQDEGHIKIEVKENVINNKNVIQYIISDNGVGIDEEKLESLQSGIKQSMQGIGVVNVNQRLKLYYKGDEYGLKIDSELDEGTTVVITIEKQEPISFIKGNV